MGYKLEQLYTNKERADFIVEYNHKMGLQIEETSSAIYALEPWEYIDEQGEIAQDKESWEKEQAQKERERIAQLSLTKREVFLALYKDKGITPEQIKAQIQSPQALIEFEYANDYFRGNPLIDLIGQTLGYTSADLDYLFENKELPEINEEKEQQ